MNKALVKKILRDTEDGYGLISEKFSQTRNKFWKELEFIGNYAKEGAQVLDFGCGNGRLAEMLVNKKVNYVGVDVCENLINLAKKNLAGLRESKKIQFLKIESDFKKLPFPSEFFDSIYSIAVFHHLPSKKLRLEVAQELYRLLKKDSYIVITVWNLWQSRYQKNIFKNWQKKILNKSNLDFNDCYVSFTNNQGQVFDRFHHAFVKYELKRLLEKSGFTVIKCRKIKGNIVAIGRK
ncbi:MAG: class I SAM-dependent methyltransferase [Parcubacteria group bacterium]|jgi:ubiquinone/menaquinone biosynthesis C-methylase UbiE